MVGLGWVGLGWMAADKHGLIVGTEGVNLRASASMLLAKSMDVSLDPLLFIFYSLLFRKSTTPTIILFRKSMLRAPPFYYSI